jgi:phosphoribosylanthranilate isomerase
MYNKIHIKICGLREYANIIEVIESTPDYIGFIFYSNSPRYVGIDNQWLIKLPIENENRVAVVVDMKLDEVISLCKKYHFKIVQLHGDETVEYCNILKKISPQLKIIKALSANFNNVAYTSIKYENICDYLLFDTPTNSKGGSGETFDWEILNEYQGNLPFFIAGGIGIDNIEVALTINHKKFFGLDLNSKIESAPGIKDLLLVKNLLKRIRKNDNQA